MVVATACHNEPQAPRRAITAEIARPALSLRIAKDGTMTLENRPVTLVNLQAELEKVSAGRHYDLAFMVEKDADWKFVNQAQQLAERASNPPQFSSALMITPGSPVSQIKSMSVIHPLAVAVIELKHSNPAQVSAALQARLSPTSTVIVDARTHNLIVRTSEDEMPMAKSYIAKLDAP
jgi:type II secretory pathway component GspD/PulD (secretin)